MVTHFDQFDRKSTENAGSHGFSLTEKMNAIQANKCETPDKMRKSDN